MTGSDPPRLAAAAVGDLLAAGAVLAGVQTPTPTDGTIIRTVTTAGTLTPILGAATRGLTQAQGVPGTLEPIQIHGRHLEPILTLGLEAPIPTRIRGRLVLERTRTRTPTTTMPSFAPIYKTRVLFIN